MACEHADHGRLFGLRLMAGGPKPRGEDGDMKGRGDEQREGAAKSGEHGHLGRSDTRGPSKVPSSLVTDRMFRYLRRVNLLVQQLKAAIAELAKRKGLHGARVLEKVNRYGEIVIALILPGKSPGTSTSTPASAPATLPRERREDSDE